MFKFELLSVVRDKITGYQGTVMSRIEYHNGCKCCGIQSETDKDGKMPEWCYIDEYRLELVASAPNPLQM